MILILILRAKIIIREMFQLIVENNFKQFQDVTISFYKKFNIHGKILNGIGSYQATNLAERIQDIKQSDNAHLFHRFTSINAVI